MRQISSVLFATMMIVLNINFSFAQSSNTMEMVPWGVPPDESPSPSLRDYSNMAPWGVPPEEVESKDGENRQPPKDESLVAVEPIHTETYRWLGKVEIIGDIYSDKWVMRINGVFQRAGFMSFRYPPYPAMLDQEKWQLDVTSTVSYGQYDTACRPFHTFNSHAEKRGYVLKWVGFMIGDDEDDGAVVQLWLQWKTGATLLALARNRPHHQAFTHADDGSQRGSKKLLISCVNAYTLKGDEGDK